MAPGMKGRVPFLLAVVLLVLFGVVLLAVAACADDDAEGPASPQAEASPSPVQAAPGTITVSSSPIVGQDGKMLLIFAAPEGAGPLARVCIPITSDDFTLPATVMTDMPAGQDPCGESTAETVFSPGTYTLTAGIYVPPSNTPEKESRQTVEVSGGVPLEVAIDGASLSQ